MEEERISEGTIREEILEEETIADANQEKSAKKKKTDFFIEMVLFLILGILVGIAVKNEAVKRITIGYNDYKMKVMKQEININELQAEVLKRNAEEAQKNQAQQEQQGASDQAEPGQVSE